MHILRNHFWGSREKKVSHWFPGMRTPKVLLLPPKNMDFWPKNGQIWPKTDIFGQILSFLAHLIQCPTQKQCGQVALVVFLLCGYQNFYLVPKKIKFWPLSSQFWSKIGIFCQVLAFLAHLVPYPTEKQSEQVA